MIPVVTVPPRPSGAPNATTCWPTRSESELPRVTGVSPETPWARSTARSELGSLPTICAGALVPSWNRATTWPPFAAASTTWLFVSRSPSALSTMPEPSPAARTPWTWSWTTLGSTRAAMASTGLSGVAFGSAGGSGSARTPVDDPVPAARADSYPT